MEYPDNELTYYLHDNNEEAIDLIYDTTLEQRIEIRKNNPKEIIVVEGFVYAPRYDKRDYIRQVESILYSFDWEEEFGK